MRKKSVIKWAVPGAILLALAAAVWLILPKDAMLQPSEKIQSKIPENALVAYVLTQQSGYDGNLRQWLDALGEQTAYGIAAQFGYEESEDTWQSQVSELAAGEPVDINAADFSDVGELEITFTDGTKVNLGTAKEEIENRVIKAEKNDRNQLVITYADGLCVNLGATVILSGDTVSPGEVGIRSVAVSPKGQLQLTLTNGTTMDLGSIK